MPGIDSYTKLLLHCDGIDGSQTFIDEMGHTMVASGNTQIDTDWKVFGTGSALFDKVGDWLSSVDSADWNFAGGDFTIETRIRFHTVTDYQGIMAHWNDSGQKEWRIFYYNGVITFQYSSNGSGATTATFTWTPIVSTAYHFTIVRNGIDLKLFIDGIQTGNTHNIGTVILFNSNQSLRIGQDGNDTSTFDGWQDEIRISNIARWTSNFTPPTSAYTLSPQETITSDAVIQLMGAQETILSDAEIIIRDTIASNATIIVEVLNNILNKFNMVKGVVNNILNKFNSAKRVLSDINNVFNSCKRMLSDINNDYRSQKRVLSDINNDVRFISSWQRAGNAGFQSLGRTYITLSINSIDQVDVNVDSITMGEGLNGNHTAYFELARAYDSSAPALNSEVEIKYHIWTLYKGYIVQVSPSDKPDYITVNCNDEYWKENKTKVYYNVGHKPQDDKELYYETIYEAMVAEHSFNENIGKFVPQTMTNFGVGKADALADLIGQCGNFALYYDRNKTKKLWSAEEGSIVTLEAQKLGTNMNLYKVITHDIRNSNENIVNKLRVQMGDKIIHNFNTSGGTKKYTSYNYSSFQGWAIPAWDDLYERLAKNSANIDGYGWDYHLPEDESLYTDVFKKYKLPYLDKKLSSWTDIHPPRVVIGDTWGMGFNPWYVWKGSVGQKEMTEGFTIDYENRLLIFNEPQYLEKLDNETGERIAVRALSIKLYLWKKNYYNPTTTDDDDPESDIANPLMFFVEMGDYPETILGNLDLSQLSIQEGGNYNEFLYNTEFKTYEGGDQTFTMQYTGQTSMAVSVNGYALFSSSFYYNPSTGKVTIIPSINLGDNLTFHYNYTKMIIIPSWDDTDFAKDYANWQLSQTCDIKRKGSIQITLDTLCFYNIDLSKRIYIPGVTTYPMNITSISINLSSFIVTLELEKFRYYKRSVSLPSRGE